jgi:hypothetical protein
MYRRSRKVSDLAAQGSIISNEAMSKQPSSCTLGLLDLPEPVLAGIAKLSRGNSKSDELRNFLLSVSRGCRDAILANASHVHLSLSRDSPRTSEHKYCPRHACWTGHVAKQLLDYG